MSILPKAIRSSIDQLDQLPGIGPKAATRLVKRLVADSAQLADLQACLNQLANIRLCSECRCFCDSTCMACAREQIDSSACLVVAEVEDAELALEKGWQGRVFVLHGLISPIDRRGPKELGLASLLASFNRAPVLKLIAALDKSIEAQATGLYIKRMVDEFLSQSAQSNGGESAYSVVLEICEFRHWIESESVSYPSSSTRK